MNNGANAGRPGLTPELTAESFAGWYWLKAELVAFCRTLGVPTTGDKRALQARIEQHLLGQRRACAQADQTSGPGTGNKPSAPPSAQNTPRDRPARRTRSGAARSVLNDSMPDTFGYHSVIGQGWRCSTALREFFVAELGKGFRFNSALRNFIHNGTGQTLADALVAYRASRKQPATEIAPQFEYNRHMRAFFAAHPTATWEEARAAWWAERNRPKTSDKDSVNPA